MISIWTIFAVNAEFEIHYQRGNSISRKFNLLSTRHDNFCQLLLILVFLSISKCFCEGSVLFRKYALHHNVSLLSTPSPSINNEYDSSLLFATSIYTLAATTAVFPNDVSDSLFIIRNSLGDLFFNTGQNGHSCSTEKCIIRSGGTATATFEFSDTSNERKFLSNRLNDKSCHCRCLQNTPVFREDIRICVNDIHECSLALFSSGHTREKIPFVFLPLKGQIINPSTEINFNEINSVPTCMVSRVRYLEESGWCDIKNYSGTANDAVNLLPFKLFQDQHRTFLQWLGNADLRSNLEGRLVLIDLICKDTDKQLIFTPCISFRVAGTPSLKVLSMQSNNSYDRYLNEGKGTKFSPNEYAILCATTLLIALIYIVFVFLYSQIKKLNIKKKLTRNNTLKKYINIEDNTSQVFADTDNIAQNKVVEEENVGLNKKNPLLMKRYYMSSPLDKNLQSSDTDSSYSNNKQQFCVVQVEDENNNIKKYANQNRPNVFENTAVKKTFTADGDVLSNNVSCNIESQSVNAEPPKWKMFSNRSIYNCKEFYDSKNKISLFPQQQQQYDTNNIEEKHPDENISIVECPEDVIQANSKHKLYFNPIYLEPELLMAPPPAAMEFLVKIREVMTVAKKKMSMKKFLPSLTEIPEENPSFEDAAVFNEKSNNLHWKTNREDVCEQTKKNTADGRQIMFSNTDRLLESSDSEHQINKDKDKRQIIQKWLQSIPMEEIKGKCDQNNISENEKLDASFYKRDPEVKDDDATGITFAHEHSEYMPISNRAIESKSSNCGKSENNNDDDDTVKDTFENKNKYKHRIKENSKQNARKCKTCFHKEWLANYLLINDENVNDEEIFPQKEIDLRSTKNGAGADAKIRFSDNFKQEKGNEKSKILSAKDGEEIDYCFANNRTTSDGTILNSSLPLDEELTMRNAIYNIATGNTTLSKLKARYGNHKMLDSDDTVVFDENVDGKYSLISEVYVNNGFDSSDTSTGTGGTSSSSNSLISEQEASKHEKVSYARRPTSLKNESSRLMIQLKDNPHFPTADGHSADFEPDTLDRKSNNNKPEFKYTFNRKLNFVDSLERPAICLRTRGSFKKDTNPNSTIADSYGSNLRKSVIGSLQEIYKLRKIADSEDDTFSSLNNSTTSRSPCFSTNQMEHQLPKNNKHPYSPFSPFSLITPTKDRQSPMEVQNLHDRHSSLIFPVENTNKNLFSQQNEVMTETEVQKFNNVRNCKMLDSHFYVDNPRSRTNENEKQQSNYFYDNVCWSYRPEDSGYLSSSAESNRTKTDSEKSIFINDHLGNRNNCSSSTGSDRLTTNNNNSRNHRDNNDDDDDDTDEDDDNGSEYCTNDGNSESGAESIETDFKFYKNSAKLSHSRRPTSETKLNIRWYSS